MSTPTLTPEERAEQIVSDARHWSEGELYYDADELREGIAAAILACKLNPETLRVLGKVHEYFCYHFPGDITDNRMNLLHNKVKEVLRNALGLKMGDDIFGALRTLGLW